MLPVTPGVVLITICGSPNTAAGPQQVGIQPKGYINERVCAQPSLRVTHLVWGDVVFLVLLNTAPSGGKLLL